MSTEHPLGDASASASDPPPSPLNPTDMDGERAEIEKVKSTNKLLMSKLKELKENFIAVNGQKKQLLTENLTLKEQISGLNENSSKFEKLKEKAQTLSTMVKSLRVEKEKEKVEKDKALAKLEGLARVSQPDLPDGPVLSEDIVQLVALDVEGQVANVKHPVHLWR